MTMRSSLARVRGLGPAKEGGVHHWWAQRLSSLALAALVPWFVIGVLSIIGADHAAFRAWLAEPGNTLMMTLLSITLFYHAGQGLQVVIEDYVHGEGAKMVALIAVRAFVYLGGGACVTAVFRISFGS